VLHAQPNNLSSFEEISRIYRTINIMVYLGTISSQAVELRLSPPGPDVMFSHPVIRSFTIFVPLQTRYKMPHHKQYKKRQHYSPYIWPTYIYLHARQGFEGET
jgi:hypothetical protein